LASFSLAILNAATFKLLRSTGSCQRIALFNTHGGKRTTVRSRYWCRRQSGVPGRLRRLSTTETEYGVGTYGSRNSSRIYGLAGETALNFSPWMIPLAFGVLAFVTCRAGEFIRGLAANDARLLCAPLLILLCPLMLSFDSDNLLWILIKVGGIPLILLALSARRSKLSLRQLPS